jgi:hypothetical protein
VRHEMKIDLAFRADQLWGNGAAGAYPDISRYVQTTGQCGGVYRLHVAGDQGAGDFASLPRLLNNDPNGRLYIGKADVFEDRLITLIKGLHPVYKDNSHAAARIYNSSEALRLRFPLSHLSFTLTFSSQPRISEVTELRAYIAEFGEPPPLNSLGA